MNVVVNGERRVVPERCTTARLVSALGLPERGIAVAVNGVVVPRADWHTPLTEDAAVEVLTAVQGG
ncbi:sulfur carrier protein ThiS [Streptomyces sp. NPDC002520]